MSLFLLRFYLKPLKTIRSDFFANTQTRSEMGKKTMEELIAEKGANMVMKKTFFFGLRLVLGGLTGGLSRLSCLACCP